MTTRDFKNQLAGQIGESLVIAELGRRNIVATGFSGNVPDIDLLAYRSGKTAHIQVKSWRSGTPGIRANRLLDIQIAEDVQTASLSVDLDPTLIYVFVKIGTKMGEDEFFILNQGDLQKAVHLSYQRYLDKHHGVRPRNPKSMHTSITISEHLSGCRDKWSVIEAVL